MSKSHATELSEAFTAIFEDCKYAFPTLKVEFERDLARLLALSEQRGIRVYLVDLPAVGKHLDRCLADGQFSPCGLPLTKRYTAGVAIPKFLRGLYKLVFEECGRLKERYSIEAVFFLRQVLYLAKKMPLDCSEENTITEVIEFYQTDLSLPEPEWFWDKPVPTATDVGETYHGYGKSLPLTERSALGRSPNGLRTIRRSLECLDFVSSLITTTLGPYDPSEWGFRHGPGAISECTRPTNKYYWRGWSARLGSVYPISEYGYYNHSSWGRGQSTTESWLSAEDSQFPVSRQESEFPSSEASRMVAVPKSFTRPRLIAAEPSEHQWCQQNIWHYFCDRATDTWIAGFVRFRDQSLNQDLCRTGSRDGKLATVDLSTASDLVTCHVVGQFFRSNPNLLVALNVTRTQFASQAITSKVPPAMKLRKFSTMGNACTFPVETLVFLGIALAATLASRNLALNKENVLSLRGEVAVFGDDIVVPVDSRELFVELLEVLYFKINKAKTFWTGRFRESCGVDAFAGVEVTPVYWKGAYDGGPESLARCVQSCNNFYKKFLLHTAAYLASTLPKVSIPEVSMRSGVFGFQTRAEPENTLLKHRYNSDLHTVECQVTRLYASTSRTRTDDDSSLLQYFTEDPEPTIKWVSGYNERTRLRTKLGWVSLSDLAAQPDEMEGELVRLRIKALSALP